MWNSSSGDGKTVRWIKKLFSYRHLVKRIKLYNLPTSSCHIGDMISPTKSYGNAISPSKLYRLPSRIAIHPALPSKSHCQLIVNMSIWQSLLGQFLLPHRSSQISERHNTIIHRISSDALSARISRRNHFGEFMRRMEVTGQSGSWLAVDGYY